MASRMVLARGQHRPHRAAQQHAHVVEGEGVQGIGHRHRHLVRLLGEGQHRVLLGEVDGDLLQQLDVHVLGEDPGQVGEVELDRQRAGHVLLADRLHAHQQLTQAEALLRLRGERLGELVLGQSHGGPQDLSQGTTHEPGRDLGSSGAAPPRTGWVESASRCAGRVEEASVIPGCPHRLQAGSAPARAAVEARSGGNPRRRQSLPSPGPPPRLEGVRSPPPPARRRWGRPVRG